MTPNIFHLASDNHPSLLSILRATPSVASTQDSHGYSLLHAAVSYNHVSLLRTLIHEFHLDINSLKDEDGETALFYVEDVNMAKILVEEFGADVTMRNSDGYTPAEKLIKEDDGEGLEDVVMYLEYVRKRDSLGIEGDGNGDGGVASNFARDEIKEEGSVLITKGILKDEPPPLVPRDLEVNLSTVQERELFNEDMEGRRRSERRGDDGADVDGTQDAVDPEFKRRIEELAERGDLNSDVGQRELRNLVTEAVREHVTHSATSMSNPEDGRDQQRRRIN
ncbi:MAG: recombinase rad51 [Watsoniomyces obsoletus]|nr:MAG: recombinase rad51 [Watsoniomyces obsoletus]